ncbi:MAG: hypothetical protein U0800_20165 [Isosphaeraceae bacterium]
MAPDLGEPKSDVQPGLSLIRIMVASAALAVAFSFLHVVLSLTLAISVLGVLALLGLRLPVITDRGGVMRWLPWVLWSLALLTCPGATFVMGNIYHHTSTRAISAGPTPRAAVVVERLFFVHLGVSSIAAMAVVVLTRGGYRWSAWAIIVLMIGVAFMACLVAWMDITGVYL